MTKDLAGKIVKQIDLTIALVTQAMIEEVVRQPDGRRSIDAMLDARSIITESANRETVPA